MSDIDVRAIAMYLPQYHPIPENDAWWGEGFTDWRGVRNAKPLFPTHYQPHVPGLLGYYDLRDPSVRLAQADLAREHGIYGFCYYYYWFHGKQLLEFPITENLKSGQPRFPFCICWANENWTRRWDGEDQEILMEQKFSDTDDLNLIRTLIPAFQDERYIRVNGKPLLLVYKTGDLPLPARTAEIWRTAVRKAGITDLYLVRVENFLRGPEPGPEEIGFDAAMEFAPYWGSIGSRITDLAESNLPACRIPEDVIVFDYEQCMRNMIHRARPDYKSFRGVFPMWDNTPRREKDSFVFINSSPENYAFWLSSMAQYTREQFVGEERLLFINAWNEWGEGCHLEPDQKYGSRYLEATKVALQPAATLLLPKRQYMDSLETTVALLRRQISDQELQLKAKDEILLHFLNSLSWRVTRPLRFLHSLLRRAKQNRKSVESLSTTDQLLLQKNCQK